jgi:hypothetical protein
VVDEGEGAHLQPEQVMHDLKDVLKQAWMNCNRWMQKNDAKHVINV